MLDFWYIFLTLSTILIECLISWMLFYFVSVYMLQWAALVLQFVIQR